MIIQRVLKGIAGISPTDVAITLSRGILCNWWRQISLLPEAEIPKRLTARNLDWHQNRYGDPDPLYGNAPFGDHSPFISVTAGSVERDPSASKNIIYTALQVALPFATGFGTSDGWIFRCYVFTLGRKAIDHRPFAEELRELNVYSDFSLYQTEGELTAKISIPPAQIEAADLYKVTDVSAALAAGVLPKPSLSVSNPLYRPPEDIANLRTLLE